MRRKINQALLRPALLFGVPLEVLGIELVLVGSMFVVFGLGRVFFALSIFLVFVSHPFLKSIVSRDAVAIRTFAEYLRYPAHLPARGRLYPLRSVRPRRAIPRRF